MKSLTLHSQIEKDGKLRLEVPCDLPPGPVEVVVVIQPETISSGPPYNTLKGILAGKISENIDVEAELQEMNQQWEKSLELPQ